MLNYVDTHDLWRLLKSNNHYPQSSDSVPIDIYPESLIDLDKFGVLLGMGKESLEKLTFMPVFKKLGINENFIANSRILSNVVGRYRKYCPECLKVNRMYKLIWQVNEINFCPIHKIKLINYCTNCNKKIPILPSKSEIGICPYCHSFLYNCERQNYIASSLDLRIIDDWRYILDYNEKGISYIGSCSNEQNIALRLLYIIYNSKIALDPKEQTTLSSIKQIARNTKTNQTFVHLSSIFHFTRKCNVKLKDFFGLDMPNDFIENIFAKKHKLIESYSCIAPWCSHYRTPGSLVKTSTSIKTLKSGNKQKYYMYCSDCGTEYSIDTNGNIVERGNLINFAWKQVRNVLIRKCSIKELKNQLKTTEDKLKRAIIFLAANHLIALNFIPYNIPSEHDHDKELEIKNYISQGITSKQIKKNLKMNYNEFLFYWLYSDIKKAFISYKSRRPDRCIPKDQHIKKFKSCIDSFISNNETITVKSVCKELKICPETLRNWGLLDEVKKSKKIQNNIKALDFKENIIKRTDEILSLLPQNHLEITSENIYKLLGIRRTVLVRNFPDLTKYIHEKLALAKLKI